MSGRVKIVGDGTFVVDAVDSGRNIVAVCGSVADAERVEACWNMCDGMATPGINELIASGVTLMSAAEAAATMMADVKEAERKFIMQRVELARLRQLLDEVGDAATLYLTPELRDKIRAATQGDRSADAA